LLTRRKGIRLLAAVWAPRVAQPLAYHYFADQRGWLGIANFGDVASNAGFAIVGVGGLVVLLGRPGRVMFLEAQERRWAYL
jgi:hypothetical protein